MNQIDNPTSAAIAPPTPAPSYSLMPGESPDILVDVTKLIPNAQQWLDSPNSNFALRTPRSLIGTEQEGFLRELLRALKYGLYW